MLSLWVFPSSFMRITGIGSLEFFLVNLVMLASWIPSVSSSWANSNVEKSVSTLRTMYFETIESSRTLTRMGVSPMRWSFRIFSAEFALLVVISNLPARVVSNWSSLEVILLKTSCIFLGVDTGHPPDSVSITSLTHFAPSLSAVFIFSSSVRSEIKKFPAFNSLLFVGSSLRLSSGWDLLAILNWGEKWQPGTPPGACPVK